VVNMLRQVGLALGVAVLIAVLGSSTVPAQRLTAFQHGWVVIALTSLASAIAGAVLLTGRRGTISAPTQVPQAAAPAVLTADVD
jgi:hypothetical protein